MKTIINTRIISSKDTLTAVKNNIEFSYNVKSKKCVCTNRLNKKEVVIDKDDTSKLIKALQSKDKKNAIHVFSMINKELSLFSKLECDSKAKKLKKCSNTAYDSKYALFAILESNVNYQIYNKKSDSVDEVSKTIEKVKSKAKSKAIAK